MCNSGLKSKFRILIINVYCGKVNDIQCHWHCNVVEFRVSVNELNLLNCPELQVHHCETSVFAIQLHIGISVHVL